MQFANLQHKLSYLKPSDLESVQAAYELAERAHLDQTRKSGEPFIVHPLEVAGIVAELHLDVDSICAALLHDAIEDTTVTADEIAKTCGEQVAEIVIGLTKLEKVNFRGIVEHQVENYRNFFVSTARDPRVVVIKLADRIHNMRTLEFQKPEKQLEIAQETMHIYAPLAGRCGIQRFKAELEDLAMKYLHPAEYEYLSGELDKHREAFQSRLDGYVRLFEKVLAEEHVEARVYGRIKHFYSIYRKMSGRKLSLSEIYDLLAVRIITKDITSCYMVLGIAHGLGSMISSRFKEFISIPKTNGYQSLHTTIILNENENLEVQIRTEAMHEMAEKGVATHWAYKEGEKPQATSLQIVNWMRGLIELGQESSDAVEYLEELKEGFLDDEIRVFSPRFDLFTLPIESTPVDFAYRVHTQVGHRCIGAKINGRIATLDTPLENGDIVEIMTSKQMRGPSLDWLNFVKSRTARERIRSWFKLARREENLISGETALMREIRKAGFDSSDLLVPNALGVLKKHFNKPEWSDVLAAIGFGDINAHTVVYLLIEEFKKQQPQELPSEEELMEEIRASTRKNADGIVIEELDGLVFRLARCCNPIPGDDVVGYVTRGRGVTIHRVGCSSLRHAEEERLLHARWSSDLLNSFSAPLQVTTLNRPHIVQQVLMQLQDARVTLHSVNARSNKNDICTIDLLVEVGSMDQLDNLKDKIRRMRDVFSVELSGFNRNDGSGSGR